MDSVKVERLDHLGVVSGVIKELGLVELIDERIVPDDQEEISTGEAIAGMILNGLGFSDRPLSLTPQFFENKPMETLFRPGVLAEHFNRFKLGRSLDKVYAYGCDTLFGQLAVSACRSEEIDLRFHSLDTTTFSLTGDYVPDTDEHAISIAHGYSKDHRSDLKQAVLEMMVSHDGGVPLVSQSWDGNTSDTEVFKERSAALLAQFEASEMPRYLTADSKLYTEANAVNLARLPFITRIPETLKVTQQVIDQSWAFDRWQPIDTTYSYQRVDLCHYGIEQRWLVIHSAAAAVRAQKTVANAQAREQKKVDKQLFHLQAQRFASEETATAALDKIARTVRYHQVSTSELIQHIQYAKKGRPTKDTPIKAIRWQIKAEISPDPAAITRVQKRKACFVLGTSIPDTEVTDAEILTAYKGQNTVERGFRFLKDPLFFVSSLFVKKPSRIQGLLMVMTLALLVYAIAQRRARNVLEAQEDTLPNQIGQPTATPTLRWIFQLLDGIHRVTVHIQDTVTILIEGLTDLKRKILRLFGQNVCHIYQLSPP